MIFCIFYVVLLHKIGFLSGIFSGQMDPWARSANQQYLQHFKKVSPRWWPQWTQYLWSRAIVITSLMHPDLINKTWNDVLPITFENEALVLYSNSCVIMLVYHIDEIFLSMLLNFISMCKSSMRTLNMCKLFNFAIFSVFEVDLPQPDNTENGQ